MLISPGGGAGQTMWIRFFLVDFRHFLMLFWQFKYKVVSSLYLYLSRRRKMLSLKVDKGKVGGGGSANVDEKNP